MVVKVVNKKVMIAGTFDIIHPGHIFFIRKASKFGDVYVVVSTDSNAERFKGEKPIVPEEQRLEVIKNIKNVHTAMLGRRDNDTLKIVEEINPDLILLGPDQEYDIKVLRKGLDSKGLNHIKVKRLDKYYKKFKLHSSSKIKKKVCEKCDKLD
jgi:FAD synthetase